MVDLENTKTEEVNKKLVKEAVPYAPTKPVVEENTELPNLSKAYETDQDPDGPDADYQKFFLDSVRNVFSILTSTEKSKEIKQSYIKTASELFVLNGTGAEVFMMIKPPKVMRADVFLEEMKNKGTKWDIVDEKTVRMEDENETTVFGTGKSYRIRSLWVKPAQ